MTARHSSDRFILAPHIVPGRLVDFAHRVVPLLQERDVLRTEHGEGTLRERLGLRPGSGHRRPLADAEQR